MPKPRKWFPRNTQKYDGDPTNIISRSSWETKYMRWLDETPEVILWSSEEFFIEYLNENDRKPHRYFPDFKVQMRDKDGVLKTYIIEVKPRCQIDKPIDPGRRSTRYNNQCRTWICNMSKWRAAEIYAKDRGWMFMLLDEYDLGIKPRPKQRIV